MYADTPQAQPTSVAESRNGHSTFLPAGPAGVPEDSGLPTPEQKACILKTRARALARAAKQRQEDGGTLTVVEFRLGGGMYALEAGYVREVFRVKELTPLPCTPPFVLGIINVRRSRIVVIDLTLFFDLPPDTAIHRDAVIIVHTAAKELGILTDEVLGVRPLPLRDVHPVLPTLPGTQAAYLQGITNKQTVIIDAKKLLANPAETALEGGDT